MSPESIRRLLAPRTLALFGGDWADAAEAASRAMGFRGELWRVHPKRASSAGLHYYRSVEELPGPPDAAFIAAPAAEVPGIAAALARRDAGGFVCFAAGFSETGTVSGRALTAELSDKAGALPYFGPNCYGFLNFFDRTALWPDQVVGGPVERGVAIICQSGTLALNLLFSDRSLPIGYLLTVGNQTCLAVEDMIELLSAQERVSAFGLYVEGVKDANRFAQAVAKARAAGKGVALVKAGRTEAAARTVHTHTGSLAGADTVFDSFCRQAGVARCESLAALCETLKIFHTGGPLRGRRVLVMGASGGDMAMAADMARLTGLSFPAFEPGCAERLQAILTDRVTISNPFDFHTHVWFDRPALRAMFSVVHGAGFDTSGLVIDCPPERQADPAAYLAVIDEYLGTFPGPPARGAVIASLPESMASSTRQRCLQAGVMPLQGQREALEALDLAAGVGEAWARGSEVRLSQPRQQAARDNARTLTESEAKAALAAHGLRIPRARVVAPRDAADAASSIGFPVVLKATGAHLEHKSDIGAVIVNIRTTGQAQAAAQRLAGLSDAILVEEMIVDGVAEILLGVTVDPQFGQALVLGAGGVLTELLRDSVTLLPPFDPPQIEAGLRGLRLWKLLTGYRGRPAGDVAGLVQAALACARYAEAHLEDLVELDINPVIVRPAAQGAIAVDALIRLAEES
ncbi:MAG TPA: acetate--CoA ligase family protein [Steroidobacteraceae bacterium]